MRIPLVSIFYLAFALLLFCGTNVLNSFKYYNIFGEKFLSPSALLFTLLFVTLWLKRRLYKSYFVYLFISLLMAAILVLMQYVINLRNLYVTFFLPIMICSCIDAMKDVLDREILKRIFYSFFIVECFIAVVERLTYHCFFPDLGYETYFNLGKTMFRSYALQGHPLSNAGLVLPMICFILVYQKKMKLKIFCFVMGVLAILCFNSRFVLILTLCAGGLYFAQFVFFQSYSKSKKTVVVAFITMFLYLFQCALQYGLGDRIVSMGVLDDSSAAARIDIFDIFQGCSLVDFLLPVEQGKLYFMMLNYTHSIVENAWIILMFRYGLIWVAVTVLIYAKLFAKAFKNESKKSIFFLVVPWLLNISSTNSLSNATMTISLIFIFQFIMGGSRADDS